MTISTKADEASMKAARMAIFGEDRRGSDFASGPWAIRVADLAHRMRAFADETAADALLAQLQQAREALGWFLEDGRFQVGVGGNPNVVKKMIADAREALTPSAKS